MLGVVCYLIQSSFEVCRPCHSVCAVPRAFKVAILAEMADRPSARTLCLPLFFFLNNTAFKLHSLWHVGYLLDDFYDFHVCSRVKLQLFNPARRPALFQGATAFGLNALLLVLACGRNCWPSSPVLSIIPLSCSCYRLDASIGGGVLCLVHNISFWGLPAELGRSPRGWVS